ncbi:hypothetical protein PHISCL_02220 [Aspergillus sclerotialis]|uniref:C2H2-type domain-containing protein n=1 Tax=Aspergillus sclerotialis TaxID=2070753 RepID=A0A3A3A1A1_9EURO|nr:hypothetical protein PHISCL_02220 [Aspergillus sclerotialis]
MGNRSDPRGKVPSTDRSFECTHAGCNKRFTRAEHLQRHALNHQPGGDACPQCYAHFKRPDLLKRHMERHRRKDIEAGGPGCGILDTRKRSWKAPDGSVVEKRPCIRCQPEAQQVPSPESSEPSEHLERHVPDTEHWAHEEQLGSELRGQQPGDLGPPGHNDLPLHLDTVPQIEYAFQPELAQQNNRTEIDQSWADSIDPSLDSNLLTGAMLDVAQLDFDQIFQPDTASSFNMPYTTALDYNWLFDVKGNPTSFIALPDKQPQIGQGPSFPNTSYTLPPDPLNNPQFLSEESNFEDHSMHQPGSQPIHRSTLVASSNIIKPSRNAKRRDGGKALTGQNSSPDQLSSNEMERPFSFLTNNPPIPQINEQIQKRLLDLVEATKPCLPDSSSIWEDPLLSVHALQEYLRLFFTRFNTAYPLIHLPTFDIGHAEPLLLLSVVLLGATYSSREAHQLAIRIHDVMRPSIFAHAGFSPRPELWTFQTILLVECFGKSRAGQKQQDMSHLFHGLLINLIRRSDCQSVRPLGPPSSPSDRDQALWDAWRRWSVAEQKKRQALPTPIYPVRG